jgi:PAS domain S-box-containing protein/putative nucleotidyltransferase with HDIG domain
MGNPLRVLIVEDSEEDALLLLRELKQGGYEPLHERVESAAAVRAALQAREWDIILCDYHLRGFSGLEALGILKESGIDIPFIIVSGMMGEEMAVEAMKSGAHDYIMKNARQRLVLVIDRELREAAMRQERKRIEEKYRRSEEQFRLLVESAPDPIFVQIGGRFAYVNPAAARLLGAQSAEQLLGRPILERVSPDHREIVRERRRLLTEERQKVPPMVQKYLRLDGTVVYVEASAVPFCSDNEIGALTYLRDITERMKVEDKLTESRESLRKALGATVEAIGLMVETRDPYTAGHQRRVSDLAGAIAREIGIETDGIESIRMAGMIHDIGKISVPAEILSKPVKLSEIEINLIRVHSQAGFDILKDIEFPWAIGRIISQHHERMDGSGYPLGLKGDQVCLEARVLAVADVVEAMAFHRPYRPGLGLESALNEISANRGRLYDERVADACLKVFAAGYDLPVM